MEYEIRLGKPIVYCVFHEHTKELVALFSTLEKAEEFKTYKTGNTSNYNTYSRIVDYYETEPFFES